MKPFRCYVLGFHTPKRGTLSFDGASFCYICKRCGQRIMLDSQGNGFTYTKEGDEK